MTSSNRHANPAQVLRTYHYFARAYDAGFRSWWELIYRKTHVALEEALEAHLPPGGRVLELGCGTGANLQRLLAARTPFGSYTGIDISEDMLAVSKAKFAHLERIVFEQMYLSREPLPEGPFDLIVSSYVLEHLPDPGKVVESAWQRLAPGGHFVLLFMSNEGFVDRLLAPLFRLLNVPIFDGVDKSIYQRFPGTMSLDHFAAGAKIAILRRPEKPKENLQ